ncbi:Alpha-galactosidase [Psidium guajava]|nr:Alpha-galactosidase [Psidium guajava]
MFGPSKKLSIQSDLGHAHARLRRAPPSRSRPSRGGTPSNQGRDRAEARAEQLEEAAPDDCPRSSPREDPGPALGVCAYGRRTDRLGESASLGVRCLSFASLVESILLEMRKICLSRKWDCYC